MQDRSWTDSPGAPEHALAVPAQVAIEHSLLVADLVTSPQKSAVRRIGCYVRYRDEFRTPSGVRNSSRKLAVGFGASVLGKQT